MRILWLTINRSHRVAHHFDDFRRTVSRFANVKVLMKSIAGDRGQNAWQLSQRLVKGHEVTDDIVLDYLRADDEFDFIFCDAFFAYINEDWTQFKIPSSIFIEDVHGPVPQIQVAKAKELGIETIFSRFNQGFHYYHPEAKFNFRCIWLPHSVMMERFSGDVEKSIDVLHTGVCPEFFYPNRYTAVKILGQKPYFKRVMRPKDKPGTIRSKKWPIDRDYDDLLQSAKICVTGGSIINAPVQKYVEIPASGSLLLSNWFPDLGMLGFKNGFNMVSYYPENLVEVVENLLKDGDKIGAISENGRQLILSRHTSEIRSQQFINFICQILGRDLEFPDVEPCSSQVNFKGDVSCLPKHKIARISKQRKENLKDPKVCGRNSWRDRIAKAGGRI